MILSCHIEMIVPMIVLTTPINIKTLEKCRVVATHFVIHWKIQWQLPWTTAGQTEVLAWTE